MASYVNQTSGTHDFITRDPALWDGSSAHLLIRDHLLSEKPRTYISTGVSEKSL
jgi:hypothetical protein